MQYLVFIISLLGLISLLVGCGTYPIGNRFRGEYKPQPTTSPVGGVRAQLDLYRQLSADLASKENGWFDEEDCDGLLFNSLWAMGRNQPILIDAAKDSATGQWFRNPHKDCYDKLEKGSDTSRDMIIGLILYAYHFERRDILEQLYDYGDSNNWIMGRDKWLGNNRTVMTPNVVGLLARALYALGGESLQERHYPVSYSTQAGYVSHLTLMQIYLEARIRGSMTAYEMDTLMEIAGHMNNNPLLWALRSKYSSGDQSVASHYLQSIWPTERLPTSQDWCAPWRTQRSSGDSSFVPCPKEVKVHSGGDFMFAAAIVVGDL